MKLSLLLVLCCGAAQAGPDYSTLLGPFAGVEGSVTAMAVDADGNVYLTGVTANPAFPATPGVVQPRWGGGLCTYGGSPFTSPRYFNCTDGFVVKLDSSGNVVFATFLGGSGQDRATSIGVDAVGNIYVAGISGSTDFPHADGSVFRVLAPTFIVKLNPSGTELLYSAFVPGTGALPFIAPFQPNVPVSSVNMVMAVDPDGNAYFAANGSPGFPLTEGALQSSDPMVVGKLDPTGTQLLYGSYLGGSGHDSVGAITVDSAGNLYLTGSTSSADFPVTAAAFESSLPEGTPGAFVAKLDISGAALIYATYLGGGSYPHPLRIRVDGAGQACVLGTGEGIRYPVTDGAFQTTWNPLSAFLSKVNADGTELLYSTFLSFSGAPPSALDVDSAGNAYVAGQSGPGFPASPDAFQPSYAGGGDDVFIAQFTPHGTFTAGTYLGGTSYESAFGVSSISDGSVVVAGITNSDDFPATMGAGPGYFVTELLILAGSRKQAGPAESKRIPGCWGCAETPRKPFPLH